MTTGPDAKKVIRQVEYYFGDSNMQRDKFLQDEVAKDAEGWVPLTTMLKVKRRDFCKILIIFQFKRLGDLVNGEAEAIVKSLKESKNNLVEVAEDGSKIRRNPELKVPEFDDNYKRQQKARTCYVKVGTSLIEERLVLSRDSASTSLWTICKTFSIHMASSPFTCAAFHCRSSSRVACSLPS